MWRSEKGLVSCTGPQRNAFTWVWKKHPATCILLGSPKAWNLSWCFFKLQVNASICADHTKIPCVATNAFTWLWKKHPAKYIYIYIFLGSPKAWNLIADVFFYLQVNASICVDHTKSPCVAKQCVATVLCACCVLELLSGIYNHQIPLCFLGVCLLMYGYTMEYHIIPTRIFSIGCKL